MRVVLVVAVVSLLAVSCRHGAPEPTQDERLIGHPLESAIGQFGAPTSNEDAGGIKVYKWEAALATKVRPFGWVAGKAVVEHPSCRRWVTVDANNIITQANHSEDCEE